MGQIKIQIGKNEESLSISDKERTFKSGSRGYHGFGKIELNGKKYQANILLVEIGSKPTK